MRAGCGSRMLITLPFHPALVPGTIVLYDEFYEQDRSYFVTLSVAKGLSRWAARCFATLSMTRLVLVGKVHNRAATPTPIPEYFVKVHYPVHKVYTANNVDKRNILW